MDNINERIALITREKCGGNRSRFAREIGITPSYAAQLCGNDRTPSDRTVADICRVFGVNRVWLETGIGEPFRPESRDDKIAKALGEALGGSQKSRARLIRALAELPEELFPAAEEIICQIADLLSNE